MALLCLGGASVAVYVSGTEDVLALISLFSLAGLGLMLGFPAQRPGWLPLLVAALLLVSSALALVPSEMWLLPTWRHRVPDLINLGAAWAAMPGHVWFWWTVLAGALVTGGFLLTGPLTGRELVVFLHVVAGVVAVYAIVSIVQAHSDWSYPYSGGANFGILPNRNHTATLLMVGSIVSFGLMQWEVARGYRGVATLSAFCGAPSLAALLFFSTSRAGVIFLALGMLLWAVGASGSVVKRRTALATAGVLAAFLLSLSVLGGSTVRDRLAQFWLKAMQTEVAEAGSGDLDFRQPVFRDTIAMISDAPVTGQGLGHFEYVFPHYREASVLSARVSHPESDWLMVAAETGLPTVALLLVILGWYLATSWCHRHDEEGMLRWTVASAIGAAAAHGIVDVPWHRPALGWFLLVLAMACLPGTGSMLTFPKLWRTLQVMCGAALLFVGVHFAWNQSAGRPPLAYRWNAYQAELRQLADARRHEAGEQVALAGMRDFPLHYQAYYWWIGFLRTFEGTEAEISEAVEAGRFVEPVLPAVAADQAQLWADLDAAREAESRMEAVRRAARIEERTGSRNLAAAELEKGLRLAADRPAVQMELRKQLAGSPVFLGYWTRWAKAELADEFLSGLAGKEDAWLDSLAPDLRGQVLNRWITLPSAAGAVAYMQARNAPAPGAYWRQLAEYYAKTGERERAVGIVTEAEGVAIDGSVADGPFSRELAALRGQGNEVAVRRLIREAVEAKQPEVEKLRVALAMYAAAGDWEMAWKAASRLVTARKNGQ